MTTPATAPSTYSAAAANAACRFPHLRELLGRWVARQNALIDIAIRPMDWHAPGVLDPWTTLKAEFQRAPSPRGAHEVSSCASWSLEVSLRERVDDVATVGAVVGEYLALLRAAVAVDPAIIHEVFVESPRPGCPLGDSHCAGCDAGPDGCRRARLELKFNDWRRGLGDARILEHALFVWPTVKTPADDPGSSAEYRAMREALGQLPPRDAAARRRGPPRDVRVDVRAHVLGQGCGVEDVEGYTREVARFLSTARADGWTARPFCLQELYADTLGIRAPLRRYGEVLGLLATSGIPLHLGEITPRLQYLDESRWDWWFGSEDGTQPDRAAEANIVSLWLMASLSEPGSVGHLYRGLARSPSLRTLHIVPPLEDTQPGGSLQQAELLGFALFSPDSALRLTALELTTFGLDEEHFAALLRGATTRTTTATAPTDDPRPADAESRLVSLKLTPRLADGVNELLGVVGHTLRRLEIPTDMHMPQFQAIARCCPKLEHLLNLSLVVDDIAHVPDLSHWKLRALELTAHGESHEVLDRIIGQVGETLTDLSLDVTWACLDAHAARRLLASCPRLRSLCVFEASDGFVEELVDGYRDGRCRLERLTILDSEAYGPLDMYYDEESIEPSRKRVRLLRALQDPRHPIVRHLRALGISPRYLESEKSERWADVVAFLEARTKVTEFYWCFPLDERAGEDRDNTLSARIWDITGRFNGQLLPGALHLPPLRCRLALLSGVRKLDISDELPTDAMRLILEFSGRSLYRRMESEKKAQPFL